MVARHHGACCWVKGSVRSAFLPKWFTRSPEMLRGGVDVGGSGSRRLVTFGRQNVTANVTNVIFFVTRSAFRSGFRSAFRSGFWGTLYARLSSAAHDPSVGSDTNSRPFPYSSRTWSWHHACGKSAMQCKGKSTAGRGTAGLCSRVNRRSTSGTGRLSVRPVSSRRLHRLDPDRVGGQAWSRHAGYGRGNWLGRVRRIFPRR